MVRDVMQTRMGRTGHSLLVGIGGGVVYKNSAVIVRRIYSLIHAVAYLNVPLLETDVHAHPRRRVAVHEREEM